MQRKTFAALQARNFVNAAGICLGLRCHTWNMPCALQSRNVTNAKDCSADVALCSKGLFGVRSSAAILKTQRLQIGYDSVLNQAGCALEAGVCVNANALVRT